jgi:hypothetical protein
VAADRSDHAPQEATAGQHPSDAAPPIIDWARTGRRLRLVLSAIGATIVVVWVVHAVVTGGVDLAMLGELVGFGLFAAFVVEVVVVGGTALRGMLAAGERGERLSGPDVSLLPPQLTRRRRR